MRKCHECATELMDDAKFCHHCGTKVIPETHICPDCSSENPPEARFCRNCGHHFEEKNRLNDLFEQPSTKDVEQEIVDGFFTFLKIKIAEEQSIDRYEQYIKRFRECGFQPSFELRVRQLAEEVNKIKVENQRAGALTQSLLHKAYEDLSDYFLIHYCQDINDVYLPSAILQYQYAKSSNTDLFQMVIDYLAFEREEETVYTNFLEMPREKLRKAGQSFLFPEKNERIYFICDQSVLGSFKEGFAMTEDAIYWRMLFEKPQKVRYENLATLEVETEWLKINGHFFNASKGLNTRLLKLLKRLKLFYQN